MEIFDFRFSIFRNFEKVRSKKVSKIFLSEYFSTFSRANIILFRCCIAFFSTFLNRPFARKFYFKSDTRSRIESTSTQTQEYEYQFRESTHVVRILNLVRISVAGKEKCFPSFFFVLKVLPATFLDTRLFFWDFVFYQSQKD